MKIPELGHTQMHLLLHSQLLLYRPFNLFSRLFAMFRLCETSFWRKRTTRGSAGRLEISCSFWCRGLASLCASFGIPETSRPTFLHMRCSRPWCSAARRTSKLPSKVILLYPWVHTVLYSARTFDWWGFISPSLLLAIGLAGSQCWT